MTRRFEQATELRAFAARLRAIRFRGAELYLEDLDGLAQDMTKRADEIAKLAEPTADTVFNTGRGSSERGRTFRAELRHRRAA